MFDQLILRALEHRVCTCSNLVYFFLRDVLHKYANEDVSLGSWFIGLDVEHVDDRRLCCGTPPGNSYIYAPFLWKDGVWEVSFSGITMVSTELFFFFFFQIVNGKHRPVISALLRLTGSAVGFVGQWRGSWKFMNNAAKTKMLYGPQILLKRLEVLTRKRYT